MGNSRLLGEALTDRTYTLVGNRRTTTVRLVWFFGLALGLTFLLNNLIVLSENQGLVGDARSTHWL